MGFPCGSDGNASVYSAGDLGSIPGLGRSAGEGNGLLYWLVWSRYSPRILNSQQLSPAPQFKSTNSSGLSLLYGPTLTSAHDYWKNHNFNYMYLCQQRMSLLFNMLSRFVIALFPRSKCLLISWLQSLSALILELKKMNSDTVSTFSPFICHEVMGLDAMIFVFWRNFNFM